MPGDVRFQSSQHPSTYGDAKRRRRKNRKLRFAAVGIIAGLLVIGGVIFAWQNKSEILRRLHHTPLDPPPAVPVAEFSAFKKLDDFVGVECIYTNKFVEAIPAVKQVLPVNLLPGSRVVVQKVVRESGDFDHPNSAGFKLYAKTKNASGLVALGNPNAGTVTLLDTLVILYPVVGHHDEVIELHLCPVAAFKKAQTLWLDQSFKYAGSQVGGTEIDPGSIVTVTEIAPTHFGTHGVSFDLNIRLPNGQTVHQMIDPDNMGLLQPMAP